eukprot:786814_1
MTEQKSGSNSQKSYSNRGRSLSRQILGNDMDLLNKYQSKYSSPNSHSGGLKRTQTYTSVPNPYGTGGYGSYNGYGMNTAYGHGYGSGSGSSTGSGSSRRQPRRQPSNLINSSTISQWDNSSINTQQEDMSAAMNQMVNSYSSRVEADAQFLNEIEDEAADNDEFGKPENAENWSVKEVCYWLNNIHLDKYIQPFKSQIIDGSILLRDLDQQMLVNELAVKRLHVKKLIREINKLKNKSAKFKKE